MSFDVFEKAHIGQSDPDSSEDEGPEVSGIVGAEAQSGGAEGLAGIASSEEAYATAKLFPREGFKIRPNRSVVQESRFHFRNQVCDGKSFDLAVSDGAQIWDNSAKSEINAPVSSAEANMCN